MYHSLLLVFSLMMVKELTKVTASSSPTRLPREAGAKPIRRGLEVGGGRSSSLAPALPTARNLRIGSNPRPPNSLSSLSKPLLDLLYSLCILLRWENSIGNCEIMFRAQQNAFDEVVGRLPPSVLVSTSNESWRSAPLWLRDIMVCGTS